MNQESITGILSPNSSRCTGSTPTHAFQEVLHSTVGWKSNGHNFLGLQGVLLVDYFPHKTTMTGPNYSELLKKTALGS